MGEDILELLKDEHVDMMIRLAFELDAARIAERLDSPNAQALTDAEERLTEQALIIAYEKLRQRGLDERKGLRAGRHRRRLMKAIEILACVVLVIGISAPVAVANFETLRQRIVEFLISFDSESETTDLDAFDGVMVPDEWEGEYFPAYLPRGTQVEEVNPDRKVSVRFAMPNGGVVIFKENDDDCFINAGAADGSFTITDINGHEARVTEAFEDEHYIRMVWDNGERWFTLETSNMELKTVHAIAESVRKISD